MRKFLTALELHCSGCRAAEFHLPLYRSQSGAELKTFEHRPCRSRRLVAPGEHAGAPRPGHAPPALCCPATSRRDQLVVYKPHRPTTYARWAGSVPENFQFSVKLPKLATHERRLMDVSDVLDRFLAEAKQLGDKLGPLLVRLPPSLRFSAQVAETFFTVLRDRFNDKVALDPRHASWLKPEAELLMTKYRVARVATDPAVVPESRGARRL